MTWNLGSDLSDQELEHFGDASKVMTLTGELINDSKTNYTQRVEVGGRFYYVKRYLRPGKHFRRFFGSSRVSKEWRSLLWFQQHAVPTCRLVAMGQGGRWSSQYWGVIVTEEISQTIDLRKIYLNSPEKLKNRSWRLKMLTALALVVTSMHRQGYIHNDLQWRNVLVTIEAVPKAFLIDCPSGRRIYLLGNRRGIVRDLAFLDKIAKIALSRADRLRFYKTYMGVDRLRERDKKEIRRILSFLKR